MPKLHSDQFALQLIYSLFLGVMFAAFIGIGVWTLYPAPSESTNYDYSTPEIRTLEAKRTALSAGKSWRDMTEAEQDQLVELDLEIQRKYEAFRAPSEQWSINTSVILIALAAVGMALSLIQGERAVVLSNGVLLGGIFTMTYGTIWAISRNTSSVRFWVVAAATVLTLVLGYLRLVRDTRVSKQVTEPADSLQVARVARLEGKLADAAGAVGAK